VERHSHLTCYGIISRRAGIVQRKTTVRQGKRIQILKTRRWLKDPALKAELDRRRAELAAQSFALLSQSVGKAVETLAGLLDAGDGRLKRLAAKDILDQHSKFRELDELTQRIEEIEDRLETRR